MSKPFSSKTSQTDWDRVDALQDEDIDFSDIPEVTPEMFARAVVRKGLQPVPPKKQVTLWLDEDIIEWFEALTPDYQDRINALLRAYMQAKQK